MSFGRESPVRFISDLHPDGWIVGAKCHDRCTPDTYYSTQNELLPPYGYYFSRILNYSVSYEGHGSRVHVGACLSLLITTVLYCTIYLAIRNADYYLSCVYYDFFLATQQENISVSPSINALNIMKTEYTRHQSRFSFAQKPRF